MHKGSKKTIALDMDEVLFPFAESIFGYFHELKGDNRDYSQIDDYHKFHEIWGITHRETMERVIHYIQSEHHRDTASIAGSYESVKALSDNHRIIVVTARQHVAEEPTRQWINLNYPGLISDVFFCNFHSLDGSPALSKAEICRREAASIFVDDSPRNIHDVSKLETVNSILFGDYPWNRANTQLSRVHTWSQLVQHINEQVL